MQKMNLKKVLLSLIVVVAVFGLIGFLIINREGKQKELSGSDILEKMPDLIDGKFSEIKNYKDINISDWEIYRDEENGFEVKLSKDWICEKEPFPGKSDLETKFQNNFQDEKMIACFNKELQGMDMAKRAKNNQEEALFVFSKRAEKKSSDEQERKNILFLKEKGIKLYSVEVANEKNIFYIDMKNKEGFNYFSTMITPEDKDDTLSILCSEEGDFCIKFAKSVAETFKFLN